ncbi:hypothetical protein ACWDGI_42940 [Streptomyces sp. NPDC001220]
MSEDIVTYDAAHIEVLEGLAAIRKRPGTGLESLLPLLHTGGSRPLDRHSVIASRFVLGPAVTNALSARLRAEVRHEGLRWAQDYELGVVVGPPVPHGPTARTGTTITFQPDSGVFGTAQCSFDALAERFRELAFINRDLEFPLTDWRRTDTTRSVRCRFPDGLRDFVAFLKGRTAAAAEPDITGFEKEDPRMAGTVEVALAWTSAPSRHIRSFANSTPTLQGGTQRPPASPSCPGNGWRMKRAEAGCSSCLRRNWPPETMSSSAVPGLQHHRQLPLANLEAF